MVSNIFKYIRHMKGLLSDHANSITPVNGRTLLFQTSTSEDVRSQLSSQHMLGPALLLEGLSPSPGQKQRALN